MCNVLTLTFYRGLLETLWPRIGNEFRALAFSLHPSIQEVLLETPAVAELEGRNALFAKVFVERVRRDPEVLGRFA